MSTVLVFEWTDAAVSPTAEGDGYFVREAFVRRLSLQAGCREWQQRLAMRRSQLLARPPRGRGAHSPAC